MTELDQSVELREVPGARQDSCQLCGRTPALGGSSIEMPDGQKYSFCHPVTGDQRGEGDTYSCFELIVHAARCQTPPLMFDQDRFIAALRWARRHDPDWPVRE